MRRFGFNNVLSVRVHRAWGPLCKSLFGIAWHVAPQEGWRTGGSKLEKGGGATQQNIENQTLKSRVGSLHCTCGRQSGGLSRVSELSIEQKRGYACGFAHFA